MVAAGYGNYTQTTLLEVAGRPAIAFQASVQNDLHYIRAQDQFGAVWPFYAQPLHYNGGGSGYNAQMALVGGIPTIVFNAYSNTSVARAGDDIGATWSVELLAAHGQLVGGWNNGIADVNGLVGVAYHSYADDSLTYSIKY